MYHCRLCYVCEYQQKDDCDAGMPMRRHHEEERKRNKTSKLIQGNQEHLKNNSETHQRMKTNRIKHSRLET
ncbi:hypothetical protein E2C01_040969 [Portunus trituberculatus]|uniref:Uncharacterized protein n=1 Tax=Portunus trituberculatus TaxID=210409 RepID=A0A5B7FQM0_PORTR|nr:hypothetical protein [Portunus trituberculatus]